MNGGGGKELTMAGDRSNLGSTSGDHTRVSDSNVEEVRFVDESISNLWHFSTAVKMCANSVTICRSTIFHQHHPEHVGLGWKFICKFMSL